MISTSNIPLLFNSPENTIPWLEIMIKELSVFWEYMRREAVEKNPKEKGYELPLKIKL